MTTIIGILAFLFGYTVKKEGETVVLEKVNQSRNRESEVESVKQDVEKLWKRDVFSKNTYGTFETATVLAAIANEDKPRPQVLGLTSTKQASQYKERDSVAFYCSNRSVSPTVFVNSGIITYNQKYVKVKGVVINNIEKIIPGMLIDTHHTPNSWTSIVESVDVNTQTIYVKDGWYKVKSEGSSHPTVPTSGIGFEVNRISKIWGVNNNVFLHEGDTTEKAVAEEIGLFKYINEGSIGGIDLVNFQKKATYGIQVRKSGLTENAEGFGHCFVAKDSEAAFVFHSLISNNYALLSFLNGNSTNDGFMIKADGELNKLKLLVSTFENNQTKYSASDQKIFLLKKSLPETFTIQSPEGKAGEFIFILNVGTEIITLKSEGGKNFVYGDVTKNSMQLPNKTSVIFVSDGLSWFAVAGNYNQVNITKKGFPTINATHIGQTYVDSTNRVAYIAVQTGNGSSDWELITAKS
ncbi:hypothetical protein ACIQZD_02785 [Peribacillus sp. NPDC096447]|uniref:hypothetical protein n=1 Tax=Peribacillus sp. NPDC096447 TaxID=3364394 RepID=UPI0037FBDFB8